MSPKPPILRAILRMIPVDEAFENGLRTALYMAGVFAISLIGALAVSGLLVGVPVGETIGFFLTSSFGSVDGFFRVLARMTPILIATVGLMVAFRSGTWNIGGEGQIMIGAIAAAGICLFSRLPPVLTVPVALGASFLSGGAYAGLAAFLKSRWNVNEVAVTMMQNFIASATLQYLVNGPWNWGTGLYPRTATIAPEMRLPFIFYPLNSIFPIAILLTAVAYFLMKRTMLGYKLRAVGSNRRTALTYGIDVPAITFIGMLISGGLCGLAGSGLVMGEFFRAQAGISGNYGFYAIAGALIADNTCSLAPLSSLLIALVYEGTLSLTALGLPHNLGEMIVGLVFIAMILPKASKFLRRNSK